MSDFDSHLRRTVFWMRIKIFAVIVAYEAAIALVLAAPVYYFFSPSAAWWTFFISFAVLSFYGINREFGVVLAIAFAFALLLVALSAPVRAKEVRKSKSITQRGGRSSSASQC
jgi:hypothetical protein